MTTKSLTDCYGRRLTVENGRPGIHVHASETVGPFTSEQLRTALDEVAPAGSYTRTDEPVDPEGDAAWWRARVEETEVQRDDWKARAVKAEKERDELWPFRKRAKTTEQSLDAALAEVAMCQNSLAGQIRRAEQAEDALVEMTAHRDQCRDTAIKWQTEANRAEKPRPLTPDDITDEMVERGTAYMKSRPWTVSGLLTAALTAPTRPEGAEDIETDLRPLDLGGVATPEQVADHLAALGYRKTGAES